MKTFTYQFLSQNWSDAQRQLIRRGQPDCIKLEGLAHVTEDTNAILVKEQLITNECLALLDSTSQILQIKKDPPQSVTMDDPNGVTQQYLMYQVIGK